jgi:hypothetical protein
VCNVVLCLEGGRADVGREDRVLQVRKGVVGRERLGGIDVEGGAGDPILLQRFHQGQLVQDAAAGRVDDHRGRLHEGQLLPAPTRLAVASVRGTWREMTSPCCSASSRETAVISS